MTRKACDVSGTGGLPRPFLCESHDAAPGVPAVPHSDGSSGPFLPSRTLSHIPWPFVAGATPFGKHRCGAVYMAMGTQKRALGAGGFFPAPC